MSAALTALAPTPGRHDSGPDLEARILDTALDLVARWGVAKTSVADVAKTAGCGRATLYRAFPGGKREVFAALGRREIGRYLRSVTDEIDAAVDLPGALGAAVVAATRELRGHEGFQFLLQHEPGLLLPYLGFGQVDRLYAAVATDVGPHLERFLPAPRAAWAAEWMARLLITFVFSPTEQTDLADPHQAALLVSRYLVPAFTPVPHPA
jgi:AcrR family transcriptional regulator